mmetsp:Transcript_12477/g.17285  ORF Transcript_12477/g.17285 Transcript_12477/m.17285 type:complete len:242 (-) Transcript_12477:1735-2460(-)
MRALLLTFRKCINSTMKLNDKMFPITNGTNGFQRSYKCERGLSHPRPYLHRHRAPHLFLLQILCLHCVPVANNLLKDHPSVPLDKSGTRIVFVVLCAKNCWCRMIFTLLTPPQTSIFARSVTQTQNGENKKDNKLYLYVHSRSKIHFILVFRFFNGLDCGFFQTNFQYLRVFWIIHKIAKHFVLLVSKHETSKISNIANAVIFHNISVSVSFVNIKRKKTIFQLRFTVTNQEISRSAFQKF